MSTLRDFKLLTFDVFGTLIDQNTGIMNALQSTLDHKLLETHSRQDILQTVNRVESAQQTKTPGLRFNELLQTIHPEIASKLNLPAPSKEQSQAFGASVGSWPAFDDTVAALKKLSKYYKLALLSNVDHDSFSKTVSGPLQGFQFDLILTAQDIGSYKPDPKNFEVMIKEAGERFGIEKGQILQTAQSQYHDHQPARKIGLKSCWIVRSRARVGGDESEEKIWDWKFDTLGEMADAVEKGE